MEALANKYRPHDWNEIVEQKMTVDILRRQVDQNEIRHSYLLCGPSGVSKTTTARILAYKINKGHGNPYEIDAASNNSVENIRLIIKSAQERSLDSEYKVYIIDECHMLSSQAWNAALKLIEEPPEYSIFIFCTTDPQKIPATILNRVQRFNLTKISYNGIYNRLKYICEKENFTNYEESIKYIAKVANGGMRDAIALLDKCSAYSHNLSINSTLDILGEYSYEIMFNLINSLVDGDENTLINIIEDLDNKGKDLNLFINKFVEFVLDLNKYIIFQSCKVLKIPESFEASIKHAISIENNKNYFKYVLQKLFDLNLTIKNDLTPKTQIEITLITISRCQ